MSWVVKANRAAQQRIITMQNQETDFKLEEFLLTHENRKKFHYCYLQQR
mgnify:FL=1|tara:strand:- start:445 stop:591 length:147 start_codon:yes stop_codon:yes gene_type:complete